MSKSTPIRDETLIKVEFIKGKGGNVIILWNVHVHDDGVSHHSGRYHMTRHMEQMNHALGVPAGIAAFDRVKNEEIEFITGRITCECSKNCPSVHVVKVTWDGKNEKVFTINKMGGKKSSRFWILVERK
jgi:hypothetical protein